MQREFPPRNISRVLCQLPINEGEEKTMSDERSLPPVSIDDLIVHDQVLEQYPFLSAQILNRWLREGSIRCFRGKEGKLVYAKADLSSAIGNDMAAIRVDDDPAPPAAPAPPSSVQGLPQMSEADAIRERLYWQRRSNTRKRKHDR
jgi:hypothetical protein